MEIYIKRKVVDEKMGIFPGMGLLLSPFAKILSVALIAALLGSGIFSVFKMIELKNVQLELKSVQIELAQEQTKTTELTGHLAAANKAIEDQNIRLKEIRAEAEKDINAVKVVNEQLNDLTKVQRNEIKLLRNRPAPKGCDDSKAWLKENLDIFEEMK